MVKRWFVTLPGAGYQVEDVGADDCGISPGGALVFMDNKRNITFAYAPGTWKFVQYQEEE